MKLIEGGSWRGLRGSLQSSRRDADTPVIGVAPAARIKSPGRALAGVASLLVHGLAVSWIWVNWPSHPYDLDSGPRRQIEVRLIPLAAQVLAGVLAPRDDSRLLSMAPDQAAVPSKHKARRNATSAVAVPPVATEQPASEGVPPGPASAADNTTGPDAATRAFDMTGALATARQVAREDGKGRRSTFRPDPGAAIQDKLEHARRADCRTINAQSMNLLASAFVVAANVAKNLVDESGCKW
jgi:hypothetical protein